MDLTLLPSEDTPLGKAMLSFWRWWLSGLQKAFPQRLLDKHQPRLNFSVTRDALTILDDSAEVLHTANYHEVVPDEIQQYLAKNAEPQYVLLLDEKLLLQKQLSFPRMAEADLQNALRYHLSSATPFQPDQLYFDYIYSPTDTGVSVQLIAVPRHLVQPALDFVAEAGKKPERMATAAYPDINLLPHERKAGMAGSTRWRIAGTLLFLFLLIAIGLTPLMQKRTQLALLDAELDVAKSAVAPLVKQKSEVLKQYGATKRLAKMHAKKQAGIILLNHLSDLIPDDSWLMELRLDKDRIKIRGDSDDAVALLEILQDSDLFTDAHFLSPVSTNRKTGRDSFYIEISIVGDDQP